jgi:type III secretory pathway component EscT
MPSVVGTVAEAFRAGGVDLAALGLAWARVTPTVALVPAFGLKALPAPARAIVALALAGAIYPALAPEAAQKGPWIALALLEMIRGLPVALAAAIPLWAATMAGGIMDTLRGTSEQLQVPVVEGRTTGLGVLFSLLASVLFLQTGGAARVAGALATRPFPSRPLLAAVNDLTAGIGLAVGLAGPLLAAAVVVEVAAALIARAASPAQVQSLLAPVRALAILAVLAVVLERIAGLMALSVAQSAMR